MTSDDQASIPAKMLPERRAGAAMRAAREKSGMSLREMAKRLGYHSHTTLSSYERGAIMPTDEAVQGYERVLGLAPDALASVLESARFERHGDAWAKRRVHLPADFAQVDTAGTAPGSDDVARNSRRPLRRWSAIAAGVLALSLAVLLTVVGLGGHRKPTPAPASLAGVRDGADPVVTGCQAGAITSSSVASYDPPQHLVGILQLRSSPRCGTSWGRFIPAVALQAEPPVTLEIDVFRPADDGVAKFRITYDGNDAYGNMLISRHECVYAQITILRRGQAKSATFQTACRQAPAD